VQIATNRKKTFGLLRKRVDAFVSGVSVKTDYNNTPPPPWEDEMEKQWVPEDADELSTHSRWDDFFLTLKLLAIALAILSAIWGITYFQSG
jgi:hypothetical protein